MNCLLAGKVWSREERLQSLDSISLSELLEFAKEGRTALLYITYRFLGILADTCP
jgi:hypothetical protein